MAASRIALAIGILGAGVLGTIAVTRTRVDPDGRNIALQSANALQSNLDSARAGVHARVTTLAELPRLSSAVATDAATVQNLTQEELAFRPRPGETILIGQLPVTGSPVSLLRVGNQSLAIPLDKQGQHLFVQNGELLFVETVVVPTAARPDAIKAGLLSIVWRVDVAQMRAKLREHGLPARLELEGGNVDLDSGYLKDPGELVTLPVSGEANMALRLVVELPKTRRTSLPLLIGAVAFLLLGVIASISLRTMRQAIPSAASLQSIDNATFASPSSQKLISNQEAEELRGGTMAMQGNLAPNAQNPALRAARGTPRSSGDSTALAETSLSSDRFPREPTPSGAIKIGRYAVMRSLGAGGMAEVFLARATGEAGFEKLVALKVVHSDLAQRDRAVEHFLDEARLASRLIHPNIVQITDLGRAGNDYYIAMEYVPGRDLERLLDGCRDRKEPVPLRVGIAILRKICEGLDAAHNAKSDSGAPLAIVHRDVKSANVLLSRDGAVKVADFGIAKANEQVHKTAIGEVKGTAAYMAPEHRIGEVVDRRADVYGVGAIAYELLTNTEINLDLARLVHLGKEGWPHLAKPTALRSDLPQMVDEVIFKALAYDKNDRYPSCRAFEEALESLAAAHDAVGTDKVIAQWVEAELTLMEALEANQQATSGDAAGGVEKEVSAAFERLV